MRGWNWLRRVLGGAGAGGDARTAAGRWEAAGELAPAAGPPVRPEQLSALALAYLGDAVHELFIRQRLVESGSRNVRALHDTATAYVRASAQAHALRALQPNLTPAEQDVARRGRNAAGRGPRSVDPAEYAQATAFEALVGYLYLAGDETRLRQVLEAAVRTIDEL